jgi:hypothetical protein
MNECDLLQMQLIAGADGELPEDAASRLTAHLAECAECRMVQKEMARLGTLADTWLVDISPLPADSQKELPSPTLSLLYDELRGMRLEISELRKEIAALRQQETFRTTSSRTHSMSLLPYAPPVELDLLGGR